MTLHDYELSKHISTRGYAWYAMLMALIRDADTDNLAKIEREWPDVVAEFRARYNAPGGLLEGDRVCGI
jgi:hypothetical protein